jgi:predicted DNA-binding antitoxin AbrB/MazE fold protein
VLDIPAPSRKGGEQMVVYTNLENGLALWIRPWDLKGRRLRLAHGLNTRWNGCKLKLELFMDSQETDVIYIGGVLKPLGSVSLDESERVRLTIERKKTSESSRQLALERLRGGIAQMPFFLSGPLPARDELHDRV